MPASSHHAEDEAQHADDGGAGERAAEVARVRDALPAGPTRLVDLHAEFVRGAISIRELYAYPPPQVNSCEYVRIPEQWEFLSVFEFPASVRRQ